MDRNILIDELTKKYGKESFIKEKKSVYSLIFFGDNTENSIDIIFGNISKGENDLYYQPLSNQNDFNEIMGKREKSGKKSVCLLGFSTSESMKEYLKSEKAEYLINGEYIVSIELINNKPSTNYQLTLSKLSMPKQESTPSIFRCRYKAEKNKNGYDVFYVFIKVPKTDDGYDLSYLDNYLRSTDNRKEGVAVKEIDKAVEKVEPAKFVDAKPPRNLLIYGAPGTGKSYYIKRKLIACSKGIKEDDVTSEMINPNIKDEEYNRFENEYVKRVTFYEDYSYEQFVGCYKPYQKEQHNEISFGDHDGYIYEPDRIVYKYVMGPFMELYIKAKKAYRENPDNPAPYFLVIEEINRAKAASVFGEIFQLLDRDKDGNSEYKVSPDEELRKELENMGIDDEDISLSLPPNLYIWATMNSADQGVYLLDSAFKRRWSFHYMDIDDDKDRGDILLVLEGEKKNVSWSSFRNAINKTISENDFDEDRLIGNWYFKDEELEQISAYTAASYDDKKDLPNPLMDKLFSYLRQDLFRMISDKMFKNTEINGSIGLGLSDIRKRVKYDMPISQIININEEDLVIVEDDGTKTEDKDAN